MDSTLNKVPILDYGYVALVETWGSDERIIEAARMSTNKGFLGWGPIATDEPCEKCDGTGFLDERGWRIGRQPFGYSQPCSYCGGTKLSRKEGDEKLLKYLSDNHHDTPFEFAGMVIEVQAPIFVFREWHRHRTQSYNEMSARYTPLPDVNYLPSIERLFMSSTTNKQAGKTQSAHELTEGSARDFREKISWWYERSEEIYQWALERGIPKELARIHLPVGRYSRMRASTCLRNWLSFLTLRMAPNAQWEIRQYANEVGKLISEKFPRTWELFVQRNGR